MRTSVESARTSTSRPISAPGTEYSARATSM
jgi:hypothetical protein